MSQRDIENINNSRQGSPQLLLRSQKQQQKTGLDSKEEAFSSNLKNRLGRNFHQLKISKLIELPQIPTQKEEDSIFQDLSACFKILRENLTNLMAKPAYSYAFIGVLLIFMFTCLGQDPRKYEKLSPILSLIELGCHSLFLLNSLLQIIEWKQLKLKWFILDFLTSVLGITGLAIQQPQISRYFKAIRTIKLIFLIKEIKVFSEPASNLMRALAKISNILIPAFFLIYVYTVVGLFAFKDYEFEKCRDPSNIYKRQNWTVYENQIFLCGQVNCPIVNNQQFQCLNPIDYGVQPNQQELINIVQGNGLMRYSNFFYALFSTLKQTFVTGSSRLIILYKQAFSPTFVQLYFYSYLIVISYIYLNIFYSLIITAEWDNEEDNIAKENQQRDQNLNVQRNLEEAIQDQNVDTKRNSTFKTMKKLQKIQNIFDTQNEGGQVASFDKINPKNQCEQNVDDLQVSKIIVNGSLELKKTRIFDVFAADINKQEDLSDLPKVQEREQIQSQQRWENFNQKFVVLEHVIVLLCCINLSLDFHGQSPKFKFIVDCVDFVFYIIFILETLTKIIVDTYYRGALHRYTITDIVLLVLCTIGVIIEAVMAQDLTDFFRDSNKIDGIFRSFKYIRIMILILISPYFHEAKLILELIIRSVFKVRFVFCLWILVATIVAICGYHLHSHKTKVNQFEKLDMVNGKSFQTSFDGIFQSFIFTLLTFYNEQWDYLMFEQYLGGGALVAIWQFFSISVGLILFSKYFMVMLMKQLDQLIDENHEKDFNLNAINSQKSEESQTQRSTSNVNRVNPRLYSLKYRSDEIMKHVSFDQSRENQNKEKPNNIQPKRKENRKITDKEKINYKIMCLHKVTICSRRIIEYLAYKILCGLMIAASCIVLMNTHPHNDRKSPEIQVYIIIDYACKAFFLIDLALNIAAYNVCSEQSYFRRSWLNIVNMIIIVIQIISFTVIGDNEIFLKIEKIKALRILFFVELKFKSDWNMQMTFHSLIRLIPKSLTLLAISIIIYSYFALILVKMYKDEFYKCQNYFSSAIIFTKNDCLNWGGDWVQDIINTSNIFNSTLYLFLVATTQGWITLMQTAMNLAGPDNAPVLNANYYISIFFVCFFFLGNLIMLNIFIGLSISNFKRLKDITTGQSKLSKNQRMWLGIKTQIYRLQPIADLQKPANKIRGCAFNIANSNMYIVIKGLLYLAFLIAISLYQSNMDNYMERLLNYLQYTFGLFFLFLYLLEFLAFGFRREYQKSFILKTVVLIYSLSYVLVLQGLQLDKTTRRQLGAYFIALQLIRFLALLDQIPYAQKMMNSLVTIFPRATNILLLCLVLLFIYAIVGMELFSFLRTSTQLDQFNQNYKSFGYAIFSLVKFSTMESPIQQINDAAQTLNPNFICTSVSYYSQYLSYGQMGCGSKFSSYIFFLSFHIFYSLLLFSTLIAVIVDSYSEVKREQNAAITKFVLYKVQKAWSKIDPEATGYIPYRQFWMFTAKLLEIYMTKDSSKTPKESLNQLYSSREKILKDMSIPIYENENGVLCFQFHDVIEGLTRVYLRNNLNTFVKSKKAEKIFRERTSAVFTGFKQSDYQSSHVTTLLILKSGLRWWKNTSMNKQRMKQYKTIIKIISTKGQQEPAKVKQKTMYEQL